MFYFETQKLANVVLEAFQNGSPVIGLDLSDDPPSLNLECIDPELGMSVDYGEILSCDPDSVGTSLRIAPDDVLLPLHFTAREVDTIHHATVNAIEHVSDLLKDGSIPREDIPEAKSALVDFRNLQAKIDHTFKLLFKKE